MNPGVQPRGHGYYMVGGTANVAVGNCLRLIAADGSVLAEAFRSDEGPVDVYRIVREEDVDGIEMKVVRRPSNDSEGDAK